MLRPTLAAVVAVAAVILHAPVQAQIHLHPANPHAREEMLHTITNHPAGGASRPSAPQVWPQFGQNNPATMMGSGRVLNAAPEMMMLHTVGTLAGGPGASSGIEHIPPSFYFTSPYDYEQDDAAAPTETPEHPDSWFDRVHKATGIHKRAYTAISRGQMPRMGYMGTGLHRPINPLIEAQELSDIDPWKQLGTQHYAMFRSPARNPEMRGQTLRRLSKSEVLGFDHTNGQYGVPLGTGLRGIGTASMGLTKFDYGPYGLGTIHPNPLMEAQQTLQRSIMNQAAAPAGANMVLGVPAGPMAMMM